MHVALAGGGTAGHVEPALAVADALRRRDPEFGVTLLGTARGLETRLVPARGYPLELIPAVPLPRSVTPALLSVPTRLRAAVRATAAVLERVGADVLVGFGGYVSLPAYLAARGAKLPYVVHEANAKPGLANRWGARFTPFVASALPDGRLPKAVPIGIPLRRAVTTLDRVGQRAPARARFGLLPDAPTLLVSGGSQGARSINRAVALAAAELRRAGVQVLHVTGPAHVAEVSALVAATVTAGPAADGPPYRLVEYAEQMELAYAAADLMLCRAGALTCAELACVGLPGAYVPLPHGNGEQRLNALPIVESGGGIMTSDVQLRPAWICDELLPLLTDADRLAHMSAQAARLGKRDADEKLVDMVLQAVQVAGGQA
jgi:UDP-N-acetylglucosamine--N-acetylmuramyl-(pentapeptide) pyrophosphoryl-undecaprenol N-acetylglucosamine transferase